jgi:hypothetical protein
MTHGQCRKRWSVARIALDRLTQKATAWALGSLAYARHSGLAPLEIGIGRQRQKEEPLTLLQAAQV